MLASLAIGDYACGVTRVVDCACGVTRAVDCACGVTRVGDCACGVTRVGDCACEGHSIGPQTGSTQSNIFNQAGRAGAAAYVNGTGSTQNKSLKLWDPTFYTHMWGFAEHSDSFPTVLPVCGPILRPSCGVTRVGDCAYGVTSVRCLPLRGQNLRILQNGPLFQQPTTSQNPNPYPPDPSEPLL